MGATADDIDMTGCASPTAVLSYCRYDYAIAMQALTRICFIFAEDEQSVSWTFALQAYWLILNKIAIECVECVEYLLKTRYEVAEKSALHVNIALSMCFRFWMLVRFNEEKNEVTVSFFLRSFRRAGNVRERRLWMNSADWSVELNGFALIEIYFAEFVHYHRFFFDVIVIKYYSSIRLCSSRNILLLRG